MEGGKSLDHAGATMVDDLTRNIDVNSTPNVLALTVLDISAGGRIARDTKVRICVRNRDVHRTHPDIVSVPTQRVPTTVAEDLILAARPSQKFGDTLLFAERPISSEVESGQNSIIYAVESLFSRKLGISSALEREEISFTASLAGVQEGYALYSELNIKEYLRMLNVLVRITKGSHILPDKTASYSGSRWVSISAYFEMWRSKDVTQVGVSAKDALRGVCVDGLCISSTYDILAASLGDQPEIRRSAA
jgi:hypothetical protein